MLLFSTAIRNGLKSFCGEQANVLVSKVDHFDLSDDFLAPPLADGVFLLKT
jgi:hypothetical protein